MPDRWFPSIGITVSYFPECWFPKARTLVSRVPEYSILKDESIWMTQKSMAELFDCGIDNISIHLKNIYKEGELEEQRTIEKISIVQQEGSRQVNRPITFYNLDAIISVGYRVNSKRATNFRIWATRVLKEYIQKGFALDDDRLKNLGGGDHWKELLDRIRDIRSSEKVQLIIAIDVCTLNYCLAYPFTSSLYPYGITKAMVSFSPHSKWPRWKTQQQKRKPTRIVDKQNRMSTIKVG